MKKSLLSLVLVVALAAAPVSAQARPGELDPEFGHHGKVTVMLPVEELELPYSEKPQAARMAMDVLPDGEVAVANGSFVLERRNDGAPARRFSGDGRVPLDPPAGWKFELADLAVDPEGKVVVAGTLASLTVKQTQDPPQYDGGRFAHGPRPRLAIVKRYLPNGSLDPSFGDGGVLIGVFGQKPPTGPGPFDYPYSTPAVGLTGLALAPDGDLVLTGYAAAHVTGGCSPMLPPGATSRSFIARLQPDGSLDPGFGSGGVLTEEQLERLSPLALSPSGQIVFDGANGGHCGFFGPAESRKLVSLLDDGRFDPGFGAGGGLPHPNLGLITALSFDSRGRLLVVGHLPEDAELEAGTAEPKWRVRRLLPSGRPDPSFGKNGTASPKLPPQAILEDLAIDARGRIVLGGYVPSPTSEQNRFLLTRLTGNGGREPRFGRRGWVTTAFPAGEATGIDVAVDARGRLLLGGILGDPQSTNNDGLAFARYKSH